MDPIIWRPSSGAPMGKGEGDNCRFLPNYEVEHDCAQYRVGTITRMSGAPGEPSDHSWRDRA